MRLVFRVLCLLAVPCLFAVSGWSQSTSARTTSDPEGTIRVRNKPPGPAKEIGRGGADIGKGVARGTGDLAKGTAGGVNHLAHGDVGSAGASVGRGVGGMSKHVGVATVKGVGKIGKGVGGEFKKL